MEHFKLISSDEFRITNDTPAEDRMTSRYTIVSTDHGNDPCGEWGGRLWRDVAAAQVDQFRPESSDHRPRTAAKMLYNAAGLHGIFRVEDRFVRCVHTHYGDQVCNDSCVEFFVQPNPQGGYFNFEFNCGGTLKASYITDPVRTPQGFRKSTPLTRQKALAIGVFHSLPQRVDPELAGPHTWVLAFFIPFTIIAHYCEFIPNLRGQTWRANFYKCGDMTSHPHWAAWSAVDERNFHLPRCFGELAFV
jgi:hypothetical protein